MSGSDMDWCIDPAGAMPRRTTKARWQEELSTTAVMVNNRSVAYQKSVHLHIRDEWRGRSWRVSQYAVCAIRIHCCCIATTLRECGRPRRYGSRPGIITSKDQRSILHRPFCSYSCPM